MRRHKTHRQTPNRPQPIGSLLNTAAAIGRGYAALGRRTVVVVGTALSLVVGLAIVSVAIVYPLWYLATHRRNIYTYVVLGAFVGIVLFSLILRLRAGGGNLRAILRRIGLTAAKILAAGMIGAAMYAVAVLFTFSVSAGLAGGIVLLFIVGYLVYGRMRS